MSLDLNPNYASDKYFYSTAPYSIKMLNGELTPEAISNNLQQIRWEHHIEH